MSEVMHQLHSDLSHHLVEIKKLFKPETKPMVTLVIRHDALPDGDVIIGDDDLDKAIAAINRRRGVPA